MGLILRRIPEKTRFHATGSKPLAESIYLKEGLPKAALHVVCLQSAAALAALLLIGTPSDAWAIAYGETADSGASGEASIDVSAKEVGVNSASGAATLSIPIDLPPGPNDLKPNLSISYSSDRENGLLGVGWDLDLPKISCSTRFGVPNYASCPRYEFGGELLVGPDQTQSYHTFDESFSKIVGPNPTWSVTSTDGTQMHFGSPTASIQGPGGIAEWHLTTIVDVFNNWINFDWSTGTAADVGVRYLQSVTYAEGHRVIEFVYEEGRPDPIADRKGGVQRKLSRRLQEIQIFVNGNLHSRLVFNYGQSPVSNQTLLESVQRFGSGCNQNLSSRPSIGGSCEALPAMEFDYSNPGDPSLTPDDRWVATGTPTTGSNPYTPPWYAPMGVSFGGGHIVAKDINTQYADINGDGLLDIISDQPGGNQEILFSDPESYEFLPDDQFSPHVFLNNGSDGWEVPKWDGQPEINPAATEKNESAIWTERLQALRFDLPSIKVKTIKSAYRPPASIVDGEMPFLSVNSDYPSAFQSGGTTILGTCTDSGAPPTVEWIEDAGTVEFSGSILNSGSPTFNATAWHMNKIVPGGLGQSGYPIPNSGKSPDEPDESEVRPWPHFQFTDLNSDGRADMVMSAHLTGFYLSLTNCSEQRALRAQPVWVPGESVTVVFMNNGSGWDLDDARDLTDGLIAESLPLFWIAAFESPDIAYKEIRNGPGHESEDYWDRGAPFGPTNGEEVESPCNDYGLAGGRDPRWATFMISYDFCLTRYDLAPVFEDLNGDGYPDLIVTKTSDPEALFHNYSSKLGVLPVQLQHRSATTESVAYIQDPSPEAAERWVRSPAYDPPFPHAHVIQIPGESLNFATHFYGAGEAQTHNIDKGVRFVDLNRDGQSDMVFSKDGLIEVTLPSEAPYNGFVHAAEFGPSGGVFINRGAQPGEEPGTLRYSAWCASQAISIPNVAVCAQEASPYIVPFVFARVDRGFDGFRHDAVNTESNGPDVPPMGISFADLSGDGWGDVLEWEIWNWGGGQPEDRYSRAWIQHPGRAGSVWVEDSRFRPPVEPNMFNGDWSPGGAVSSSKGYSVTDVNGDGVADIVGSQRDYMAEAQSYASTDAAARADLLTEYRNGQGLRVQLQYQSALQQRDVALEAKATTHSIAPLQDSFTENDHLAEPIGVTEPPLESWPVVDDVSAWSPKAVLASKAVTTLNMATATTSYRYADPRRCEAHKTHLGFRLVRESRPDQSSIETYYYQKHGRAGKVADQIAFDEVEKPVRSSHSVWRIPDPETVEGGWRTGAEDSFGVSFIGRLEETSGRNEYGDVVGESIGFESRTRYVYNDVAGYNFVDEIYQDDLGRSSRTEHVPSAKDVGRHLMNRVAQVKTYANLPGDSRLLAHRKLFYTDSGGTASRVKPSRIEDYDANRDAASTSRWNVTHFGYASNGNLLEKRIQAATGGTDQVTTYCYDGPGCGSSSGQGSQSILAGVQDAAGKWSYFDVDDTFPVVTRSWSAYADVPTTLREYDSFGRPVKAYFESKDASWTVLLESIDYVDFPTSGISLPGPQTAFAPFRVSSQYSTIVETKESSTIEVGNGAGSAFLAIELLREAGTSAKAIATESQVDAVAREVSRSDAFSCGANVLLQADAEYGNVINACLGISAASKDFTHSTLDALGRPVRVETPLGGIEIMEYSTKLTWTLGGGPGGAPHDAVLHKNANGGLKETLFAGSLPAVVRECNNTVMDPTLESLSGVSCATPHETRFWYEPTGELRQVEDPTAPGTSCGILGPCLFMNQRFAYDYDTLGRVVKIHDPDAAVSTQAYDVFGNLTHSKDARLIETVTFYDVLNRPTQIDVALEATPTVISYLPNQLQAWLVTDGALEKQFAYDHMGRVEKTRWKIDEKDLYVNYEYDYLNRPTRIIYPTLLNGYKDTIVYEYEGAFLDRVCDIGVTAGTCSHGMATSIVSGIDYDAVGRPVEMSLPSVGTRSFEYDRLSGRRKSDSFESAAGDSNHVDYRYETMTGEAAYDRMGNLTRVHASFGETSSPSHHEYLMEYAYDARNRIQQWTMDGAAKPFAYDARGNMTNHGGDTQTFAPPGTAPAHAIQSRTAVEDGSTYNYTYTYDGAGNLLSRSRSTGGSPLGTAHYKFDGRGRLVCVGTTGPGSCNTLSVTYNGMGERVKETGSKNYLYAGPGFRLNPDAPAWDQEYWIEIEALGERIAYKHVIGGSLRTTGMLGNPGIELTPREREILIGLGLGLGLALLVVTLGGIARAPSPARAGLSVGVSALIVIVPYQAWAGGGSLPPPVSGTAIFRWVVSDAIGSSLVEIDATGTIVSRSAYRPFGGIEQQWGASGGAGGTSGSGSRTYYAGHDRQTDTGLVYMNARWMDPGSGGFISVDPVISNAFEPMAYNGYSYVENNPIMFDDPTGMYTLHTYMVDLAATGLQVHVGSQEISEGGDSAGSSGGGGGGPGSGSGPAPAGPSGVSVSTGGGGATAGVSAAPVAGTSRNAQGSQSQGGGENSGGGGTVWDGVEEFIVYHQGSHGENEDNGGGLGRAALGLIPFFDAAAALLQGNYGAAAGHAAFDVATIIFPAARIAKLSKVAKAVRVRQLGQFTIKTKVVPGRGPGMSRAEITTVRNSRGDVIRTYKDSFDRANVFQHRKPLRGGPEGRAP